MSTYTGSLSLSRVTPAPGLSARRPTTTACSASGDGLSKFTLHTWWGSSHITPALSQYEQNPVKLVRDRVRRLANFNFTLSL